MTLLKRNRLGLFQMVLALSLGTAMAQNWESRMYRDSLPGLSAPWSLTSANQLQIKGAVYAYATKDSLHVGALQSICPVSTSSCICFPMLGARVAYAFPGPSSAVIPAISLLTGSPFQPSLGPRATVAYVRNGALHRMSVQGRQSGLQFMEPVSVNLGRLNQGQVVHAVASAVDAGLGQDSSLVVTGEQGYFRHIEWKDGRFGAQAAIDGPSEGIRKIAGGVLAGSTGKLYTVVMDAPFHPIANAATPSAPDFMDETGALWKSGTLGMREGGAWSFYRIPAGAYRAYRAVRDLEGLSVFLYPEQGAVIRRFIQDRPTRIDAAYHGSRQLEFVGIEGRALVLYGGHGPESLTVSLTDPDGNFLPPSMIKRDQGGANPLVERFLQSNPNGGCITGGGVCINPTAPSFKITMTRDSLRFSMQGRFSRYFPGPCGNVLHWQDTLVTVVQPWKSTDELRMVSADRGIEIRHEVPDGIQRLAVAPGRRVTWAIDRSQGLAQWPWEGAGLSRAMLFAADGRPMGLIGLKESLAHLPAGAALLRPEAGEGVAKNPSVVRLILR